LADLHIRAIEDGSCTSHYATSDKACRSERNILRNLYGLKTTDHRALGEHRCRSKVPARFAIKREGLSHVSKCLTATCGLALCACLANATSGKGRDDDVVTFNYVGDASADLFNNSCTFMAQHCRRGPAERTCGSSYVAVAHTSSHHLDDDFASTWFADFESVENLSFVASENDALHEFPQR